LDSAATGDGRPAPRPCSDDNYFAASLQPTSKENTWIPVLPGYKVTSNEERDYLNPVQPGEKKTFKRKGTWISRKASYKHPLLDSIMCLSS
jgi:hypothetical protein